MPLFPAYGLATSMLYQPDFPYSVPYAAPLDVQALSVIKFENSSPVQANPMYNETIHTAGNPPSFEPTESCGAKLTIDVDTLMRVIKVKQTNCPQLLEPTVPSLTSSLQTPKLTVV
jgi:hypothetical protein